MRNAERLNAITARSEQSVVDEIPASDSVDKNILELKKEWACIGKKFALSYSAFLGFLCVSGTLTILSSKYPEIISKQADGAILGLFPLLALGTAAQYGAKWFKTDRKIYKAKKAKYAQSLIIEE